MRAFGFALVVIGACVIFLGWKGKIGAALTAIWTGSPPTGTTSTSSTTTAINKISSQTNAQNLPANNGMNTSTYNPYNIKTQAKSTWNPYNIGG